MPDLTERLREKLIERIRRIVEDHRPSDHIDDAVCLFRRRGAPSGFRTPDPLIKGGRLGSVPVRFGRVPFALDIGGLHTRLHPVEAGRFRSVYCHLRRISVT